MPILNEILEEDSAKLQSAHAERGIANQILEEDIQRHYEPTGEKSLTGRPDPKKFIGKGGSGGSWWTHLKQGVVDDPFTKVKIYAADRFPDLSEDERLERYQMTKKGEVIYKADDGKWYSEAPDLFHHKLKRFTAETAANSPSIVLGAMGEAAGGIPGAIAGAAAGETIRKNIGTYLLGEKTPMGQYLKDVAIEGAFGGVGSIPARGGIRIARKAGGAFGGRTGMRVTKALGSELPYVDFKKARALQQRVKKEFDIDLFDAQTTESRRLLNRLNLYGDLPETTDLVQIAKKIQDEQAEGAVNKYFTSLYDPDPEYISERAVKMSGGKIISDPNRPPIEKIPTSKRGDIIDDQGFVTNRGRWLSMSEAADITGDPKSDIIGAVIPGTDPLYAGQKLTDASKKAIEREINARVSKAAPLYKKAFDKKTKIDITPHIDELDEMIAKAPETSPRRIALERYKRMLHKTETNAKGKKFLVPESRIEYLDELKKSTDEFIDSFGDTPIGHRTQKDIRTIKNNILEDLDTANKDYKIARETWADDSDAIERLTHKTRLQGVAGLEGDHVNNASKMLFNNLKDSPALVKRARARIIREDPDAWDAALRTHIEDIYNSTTKTTEGGAADSAKVFGNFYRKTIGSTNQRKILLAAMGPEKFKEFEFLVDTLRRVALVVKKESQTAPRAAMMQEDVAGSGFIGRQIQAAVKPLVTHRLIAIKKMAELQTSRNRRLMAEAMLDPRASKHLLKIRRMGVNTEKGIRAFSTFASLVVGGEFRRHGSDLYESYEEYKKMNRLQPQH